MWLGDLVRRHMAGLVDVSAEQGAAMERHYEMLLRWNEKINLTTVTELHEAAVRHYCESVFLSIYLTEGTIIDIGSGAGFPGIPVAIMRPAWPVHLVESHQRKAVFLREATRELSNVNVLAARAESVRERYAWLISRAVALNTIRPLKLADRFAVLCGAADAASLKTEQCIPLPWGRSRVLAVGRFT